MQVFEHDCLFLGKGEEDLKEDQLKALQQFFRLADFPYYTLINNGIRFCEYVGVIQVGNLTIEVLPKIERHPDEKSKGRWQRTLIDMLRLSGMFNSAAPSSSNLRLKPNSVLDLYFGLFVAEVEQLMHKGLTKQYIKQKGNQKALKGRLLFAQHVQQNVVHRERFYVQYSTYNTDHAINRILYKTLKLLKRINKNGTLNSRIGALLLDFPEVKDISVTEATFDRLHFDRKTEGYRTALSIARLILLNYHPDVTSGRNDVLALMFNMNYLWEKFILASLRKFARRDLDVKTASGQEARYFWRKKLGGRFGKMYADIWLKLTDETSIVLDTKWKNFDNYKPKPDDLRQMYVYHDYFEATKVALVYPSMKNEIVAGRFAIPGKKADSDKECSLLPIKINENALQWQKDIYNSILVWIKS